MVLSKVKKKTKKTKTKQVVIPDMVLSKVAIQDEKDEKGDKDKLKDNKTAEVLTYTILN